MLLLMVSLLILIISNTSSYTYAEQRHKISNHAGSNNFFFIIGKSAFGSKVVDTKAEWQK